MKAIKKWVKPYYKLVKGKRKKMPGHYRVCSNKVLAIDKAMKEGKK